jgi:pSer/pThr/pTyr-binding forkhead associated (FHA) protein
VLVVIYGAELGRKYHIDGREMTIGRGTLNDICVSQDSVSRTHATLRVEDAGVKIRDNESTNGTYVNDHKVHEAWLKDGDLVKIGRAIFKFLSGGQHREPVSRGNLSPLDGRRADPDFLTSATSSRPSSVSSAEPVVMIGR